MMVGRAANNRRMEPRRTRRRRPIERRHDRIDFVFASKQVEVKSAEVVGERAERADVVTTPYPSDHRGVVVEAAW